MATYRDPDDRPVDPEADDEPAVPSSRQYRTLWRPVDPDADRPARLAEQNDAPADYSGIVDDEDRRTADTY